MSKVYFSLHEANEMVPKIKGKINRIMQLRDELELLDNTKIEFDEEKLENYLLEVELNKNFHEKSLELYSLLGELIKQGCVVRKLDNLEVDFYSSLDNRDIVFCWQPGEGRINYWHLPHEGSNVRRPIKEIEKKYLEKLNEFK